MELPRWFQTLWIRAAAGSAVVLSALSGLEQDTSGLVTPTPTPIDGPLVKSFDECQIECITTHMQEYIRIYNNTVFADCDLQCASILASDSDRIHRQRPSQAQISSVSLVSPREDSISNQGGLDEQTGVALIRVGVGFGLALGLGLYRCIKKHCRRRGEYERLPLVETGEDSEDDEEVALPGDEMV